MAVRKARNSIGIIFPSISKHFRDSFFDSLIMAFEKKGYNCTLCMTRGNLEQERNAIEQLAPISDCLILMSCARHFDEIKDVIPHSIPTIYIFNQPEGCDGTCILESDYSATYQGVISVANQGYQNMAFVCTNFNHSFTQSLYKTYTEALSVVAPDTNFDDNVFEIDTLITLNPKQLLDEIIKKGFDSIFCSTSPLTTSLIDTIIVYQPDNPKLAVPVLGYAYADNLLSCRLYANTIIPPYDEIINLTVQQALYQISHPNSEKRAFLLKGTLHMHQMTLT